MINGMVPDNPAGGCHLKEEQSTHSIVPVSPMECCDLHGNSPPKRAEFQFILVKMSTSCKSTSRGVSSLQANQRGKASTY